MSEFRRRPAQERSTIVGPVAVALALGGMIVIAVLVQAAGGSRGPATAIGASPAPRPTASAARSTAPSPSRAPASGVPGGSGEPSPDPGASPDGTPAPSTATGSVPTPPPGLEPPPAEGPFQMDLYGDGDFISQIDASYSTAASMQTMTNIMRNGWDRRNATQRTLAELARSLSPQPIAGPGAEPEGWAAGLDQLGYGPYVVDLQPTLEDALKTAARAMRFTNRPVGLLVWRGAHTWVLSGFEADADPAFTDEFTVTGFYVEDVWAPKTSKSWGNRPEPDSLVSLEQFEIEYLPWRRPSRPYPDKDGRYVLVLPALPPAAT